MSSSSDPIILGEHALTLEQVAQVAREGRKVKPLVTAALDSQDPVARSARWVGNITQHIQELGRDAPAFYGINTGFGGQAGKTALDDPADIAWLQRNLIVSHAAGVGRYLDEEIVRAAILIRANSLAQGFSGARPIVIDTLIEMLNKKVYPAIPEIGSLGASGDLVPLAHLALVMTRPPAGEDVDEESGEAFVGGLLVSGKKAMRDAGIERLVLSAKEGLALTNGTSFSTAVAVLALLDAENLVRNSEIGTAMSLSAVMGFRDAFLSEIHRARGHTGQIQSAQNIYNLVRECALLDEGDRDKNPQNVPPQDAYSLRCAPQVIGAVRDTLVFVRSILAREINAASDNPLIFLDLPPSRTHKQVSGGNFHGEYIAFAMDFLGIAVAELGSISERRIFRLTDESLSNMNSRKPRRNDSQDSGLARIITEVKERRGKELDPSDEDLLRKLLGKIKTEEREIQLPAMLIEENKPGLSSGFMIPQYVAAALVSENKTLAHPDSVDSIPTSANQEDHVSMSMNAARHAWQIVRNTEFVIAIELLCAAQAVEIRTELLQKEQLVRGNSETLLGPGINAALEFIRLPENNIPKREKRDAVMYHLIRPIVVLVRQGKIVQYVRQVIPGLTD